MMIRLASWRRFGRDEGGVAATEFALTAPLLILFYFGLVEVCSAYMAQKRMSHVTSMMGDLVAQQQSVTVTDLSDIANIGTLIMKPFPNAPLSIRVSSMTRTGNITKVNWSWRSGTGMPVLKDNATVTLPANLILDGESIIVSEASYDYKNPVDDVLPGLTKFKAAYYLRPRATNTIPCTNCPANK